MVLATQHGAKQLLLLEAEQVQAPAAALAQTGRLAHPVEDPDAGLRPIDDRQGAEVAVVGGARDLMVVVEVRHALIHGTPGHLPAPAPLDPAADLELARVIDNRLDAQDLAELIVHLQPVVLDPCPGPAVFLAVGQHLAIEAGVQAAAQEGQDVLGGEVQRGVVEQVRVEVRQGRTVLEEDVGAVLGLVDDPVIALALQPGRAEQGVDLAGPAVEDLHPAEAREAVGEGLRPGGVVELGEGVVVLHEAEAGVVELSGQPVVAVDADLGGEGEPGLQADVAEPELGVEEVEVQDPLGPAGEDESGSAVAVAELDGAAGFLTAEDTDEAVAEAAFPDLVLHEVFLAVASLEVEVGGAVLGGEVFGVGDQEFGLLLGEGEEVLAADAEGMVHEAVEVGLVGEGEVSLEEDAIVAAENGDDGRGEPDEKRVRRLHGVLLQKGACATPF
jgi:hypothetical protein